MVAGASEVESRRQGKPTPAAQYVRMSTDHQRYSIENQAKAIGEFAQSHGLEIIRTYEDWGKSGLRLEGRNGLKQLLQDVIGGDAGFEVLVVYDISRWGRFQDADESAYYEFLCRKAGVHIVYCAEPFENDGSPLSAIWKSVKRAMAGEFSRELSQKVFLGHFHQAKLGRRQGGPAGYGLRRQLIDPHGRASAVLERGEHKALRAGHTILVPGPPDEVAVVRRVYRLFAITGLGEKGIADQLNAEGITTDRGKHWSRQTVHELLTNERYIGNCVWNRVSFKLGGQRRRNPGAEWARADGAFQPIVDLELFNRTQEIIHQRSRNQTDEQLLASLRDLLERSGRLTAGIIDDEIGSPSSAVYRHRFGTLVRAYELVGYRPAKDYSFVELNRRLRTRRPALVENVAAALRAGGRDVEQRPRGALRVDETLIVSVDIARCCRARHRRNHWWVYFGQRSRPDVKLVVRMDRADDAPLDYYVFPASEQLTGRVWMAETNPPHIDRHQRQTLEEACAAVLDYADYRASSTP